MDTRLCLLCHQLLPAVSYGLNACPVLPWWCRHCSLVAKLMEKTVLYHCPVLIMGHTCWTLVDVGSMFAFLKSKDFLTAVSI